MTDLAESSASEIASHRAVNLLANMVSIQYLRAAAAIMVVFHHIRDQMPGTRVLIPTMALRGGVDIFFVISGFIMTYTIAQKPATPVEFFERRLVRIVPLYWTMTLFSVLLVIAAPQYFRDTKFSIDSLIASLFFLPIHNAGQVDKVEPMLKLGWTLNFEMLFYLVFAMLIYLQPLRRAGALFLVFMSMILLLPLTNSTFAPVVFYSNPIALEFVFGCIIGALCARSIVIPPALAWVSLALAIPALIWFGGGNIDGANRVLNLGLAAAVIVFALSSLEIERYVATAGLIPRILKNLGDASYSIYLTHLFPLILIRIFWVKVGLPTEGILPAAIFIVISATVTIATSVKVYTWVEKPLTDWTRSRVKATKSKIHMSRALP
jgi:exopolysaccharide production protein ExoZ